MSDKQGQPYFTYLLRCRDGSIYTGAGVVDQVDREIGSGGKLEVHRRGRLH